MKKIIAIQGAEGSNHHKIARDFYGTGIQLKECMSFDILVDNLLDKTADIGIMALENTIAGSIIPNYALIDQHNLHIIGEEYLNIHHHLMALPNQKIEDITEVCSHPMALLQCKEFFKRYPKIKLIEDVDTAQVAKRIAKNKLKGVAAIAPKIAAEIFNLQVIEDGIQTMKENATRFVIVQTKPVNNDTQNINKASLKFELDHKRGSLATILNVLSDCKMNLTKIQSLPVIEAPWKYSFFVDVTFDNYQLYEKAIAILKIMAEDFKILGAYKNGRK
ncbi:prephenate dehydratase [Tenacibaculum finnmarkense]|uniref:prephenate dehydratase n=1 Tax=Tenacibaculum finnmarkense genomovar ulcerans TaxID=2781388 RepID=A0A2I2MAL7_9FLAO|nr:prephenate dehydratase [Tenacibaculum finnmarkense]MBE7698105.1 prephenate dehydratase [Tenacibaculum finnmarkense genomovar ulcerans]SOU89147.1 Prephenate dehydratase [Tenacibaculum finnmarkense genomovar ulcerans]